MRWPLGRRKDMSRTDVEHEERLRAAEAEASRLVARAEAVAESLTERLRRNHWGETVRETVRRRT